MKTLFLMTSILLLQTACLAQDKIYILFENNQNGMRKFTLDSPDSLYFFYTAQIRFYTDYFLDQYQKVKQFQLLNLLKKNMKFIIINGQLKIFMLEIKCSGKNIDIL